MLRIEMTIMQSIQMDVPPARLTLDISEMVELQPLKIFEHSVGLGFILIQQKLFVNHTVKMG